MGRVLDVGCYDLSVAKANPLAYYTLYHGSNGREGKGIPSSNKENARAPPHTFSGKGRGEGAPGRSLYLNQNH